MFRKFTSERVRRAQRRRFIVLSVINVLLVVSVVLFFWQLSYLSLVRIDTIAIGGTRTVSKDEVGKHVRDALSGTVAFVFSKRNALLYPKRAITQDLTASFPRIAEVRVGTKGLHTLSVEITERQPAGIVCDATNASKCFFLDASGFLYAPAPSSLGSAYVRFVIPLSGEPVGTRLLGSRAFSDLQDFLHSLFALSFLPTSVTIAKTDLTLSVRAGNETVRLLVSREEPYATTTQNLSSLLSADGFSVKNIEYIDLRFGNKVFYREAADTPADATAVHATPQSESSALHPAP
jgi:cell division septal protein FtsQ